MLLIQETQAAGVNHAMSTKNAGKRVFFSSNHHHSQGKAGIASFCAAKMVPLKHDNADTKGKCVRVRANFMNQALSTYSKRVDRVRLSACCHAMPSPPSSKRDNPPVGALERAYFMLVSKYDAPSENSASA